MASLKVMLTTTGTQDPVEIPDFGLRTFAHPTTDYDLLDEFSLDEIMSSNDLQALVDDEYITISINNRNIRNLRNLLYNKSIETIVDINGNGDYTSLSAAFANGATSVLVRKGTYVETSDIIMPTGGRIQGETAGQTIIALNNCSIIADGNNGVAETAGTISTVNNSATITGVGTTFTNLAIGDYILIDTVFRLISNITNDTSLELDTTYEGNPFTGHDYIGQTMLGGVVIQNLIITSIAGIKHGIYMRACNRFLLDTVLIQKIDNNNIHMENCGDSGLTNVVSMDSSAHGVDVINCYSCILDSCAFNNNNNNGINIGSTSKNITLDGCKASINNNHGIHIDGDSEEVSITDSMIMQNDKKGINATPGTLAILINSCTILRNGNVGADFDGSQNAVNDCIISDNDGDGISAGDKGVIVSCHIYNNAGTGISLTGDKDSVITGNSITNNGIHGIHCNKQRNIISCNQIFNNTSNGIFFELGAVESIINDNCIRGNVFGISAVTDDTVISNNVIQDNSDDGVSVSGNDNIITGNRIFGNTIKGIDIITGSTDNIVTGNNCKGNTGTNLDDNGTTTELANNKT